MERRTHRPRVLVVEDDRATADLLREILESEGFDALTADHDTPIAAMTRHRPCLLVLDLMLGGTPGSEVLDALRRAGLADVPVVLLSGSDQLGDRMREFGAVAYVSKPFEVDDLVATCRTACA